MKQRIASLAAIATCVVLGQVGSGLAQETKPVIQMESVDFLIRAPTMIGQRVRILGQVTGPNIGAAILAMRGGTVMLSSPWTDREQMRKIIPECSQYYADENNSCFMQVEGTVKSVTLEQPELVDVKFLFRRD